MSYDNVLQYYSVFYNKYDKIYNSRDLFTILRENYFKDNKKQKNKVVDKLGDDIYHYSYCLEHGKPMKWKKMKNSKLIEKSIDNKDGSYLIAYYNDKRIKKIMYFNNNHTWLKSEYYNDAIRTLPPITLKPSFDKNEILLFKNDVVSPLRMRICEIDSDQNEILAINASIKDVYIKVYSNHGPFIFCTPEGIEQRKNLLNELRFTNNELFNNNEEYNNIDKNKKNSLNENSWKLNEDLCDISIGTDIKKIIKSLDIMKEDINTNTFLAIDDEVPDEILLENKIELPINKSEELLYEENDKLLEQYFKESKRELIEKFNDFQNEPVYLGNEYKRPKTAYEYHKLNDGNENTNIVTNECSIQDTINAEEDTINVIYINNQTQRSGLGIYFNKKNSLIYIGKWKDVNTEEKGSCFDIDGNLLYLGYFKNYNKNGYGTEYNSDGNIIYKGIWKNNLYNGNGTLYYPNGNKIKGEFIDGKICGFALEYDSNGTKSYEGDWKNNAYNGNGCKIFKNGNCCKGKFIDGNLLGEMSAYDKYGNIVYKGECKDYTYEGKGTYYVDGHMVYDGEFFDNCYNGFGKKYENGSCVFEGNFKFNVKSGFGTSYEENQIKYIGFFENNNYNGYGVLYKDNVIFVGEFLNGRKHGVINIVEKNCVTFECIYQDDELIYMNEYSGYDLVYRGNIRENKRNGMGCTFNSYGGKEEEGIFLNGKISKIMKVNLSEIEKLPQVPELIDTDYEKYRLAPNYVIEKNIDGAIYSGLLNESKPEGKGTILHSGHRYTGNFKNGKSHGYGTIYKNDGDKVEGVFSSRNVGKNYSAISCNDVTYYVKNTSN